MNTAQLCKGEEELRESKAIEFSEPILDGPHNMFGLLIRYHTMEVNIKSNLLPRKDSTAKPILINKEIKSQVIEQYC